VLVKEQTISGWATIDRPHITAVAATSTTRPEPPELFLAELNSAFESGDADFLLTRLNEAITSLVGVSA